MMKPVSWRLVPARRVLIGVAGLTFLAGCWGRMGFPEERVRGFSVTEHDGAVADGAPGDPQNQPTGDDVVGDIDSGDDGVPCEPDDQDCDQIPDARDPWPTTFNSRLFAAGNGAGFSGIRFDSGTWDATGNVLSQTTTTGTALATLDPPPVSDNRYFVESRVLLGEIGNGTTRWAIGQRIRDDEADSRSCCEFWWSETYLTLGPTIHIVNYNPAGSSGTWNPSVTAPFASGLVYYVQSWADDTLVHCRVFDEQSNPVFSMTHNMYVPTVTGTIRIYTVNRAADVTELGVFAQP